MGTRQSWLHQCLEMWHWKISWGEKGQVGSKRHRAQHGSLRTCLQLTGLELRKLALPAEQKMARRMPQHLWLRVSTNPAFEQML